MDNYFHVIPKLLETTVNQFANELFGKKTLVKSFRFTANTPTNQPKILIVKKEKQNMKEIKSEQEFKDIIASEEPVVVKFFTTWCPDCVRMDNFIGDVMEEFNKFEWYSINKDEFPSIAEEYQVMGIPSLLVYQNGEKLGHLHSANAKTEEQVTEFLEAY